MFTQENLNKVVVALMIAAISWLFLQSLQVNPVVTAVEELKIVMVNNQRENIKQRREDTISNAIEHSELAQNNLISNGRARLKAIEHQCHENKDDIGACKEHVIKFED